MISYLQHKLNHNRLYRTSFGDEGFVVWKPMTWGRYKQYREAALSAGSRLGMELEESVYEECVVFSSFDDEPPSGMNREQFDLWRRDMLSGQPYGVISTVSSVILRMSGTGSPKKIQRHIDLARGETGLADLLAAVICKTFPSYTIEDIDAMDWPTVCSRLIQVEMVTGARIDLGLEDHEQNEIDAQRRAISALVDRVHEEGEVDPELRADQRKEAAMIAQDRAARRETRRNAADRGM